MKNRNNNSTTQTGHTTRDTEHKARLHQRTHKQRYSEKHTCSDYLHAFNHFGMGVDYE